jgi:hypothetical protein
MDKKGCDRKMAAKTGIDTTRREDLSVRAALSLADMLYDYTITRFHIARKRQTRTLDICHEDYELRYPRYPEDQDGLMMLDCIQSELRYPLEFGEKTQSKKKCLTSTQFIVL